MNNEESLAANLPSEGFDQVLSSPMIQSNEQILKAAIEKAQNNGFWLKSAIRHINLDSSNGTAVIEFENGFNLVFSVFRHDFAKAFWKEEDEELDKILKMIEEGNFISYDALGYKHRLQEMIISPDPIQYLAKYI